VTGALILRVAHGTAAAVAIDDPAEPRPVALPGHAAIALDDALAALHAEERARARHLAPLRRRDWVAGRLALRAALDAAGLACDAPVLADDRGAPVLPAGVRGSISHKRGVAVAIAAAGIDDERIGVDVEQLAAPRVDIGARILTEAERAALAAEPDDARGLAVTLRFAIKEAIYKAVDPFVRRYVGFREVAVWPDDGGGARVEVEPDAALPLAIEAAWTRVGALVVCTARARRR
jgi:phosphopantetheine--protein transferase-like protein